MKETKGQKIFKVFNYTILCLLGLATFYPFWYVLVASFNTGRDFLKGGVWLYPRQFTLENYIMAFKDERIYQSLSISVSATLLSVVVGLLFTALIAYALSIRTLPGRTFLNFFWYFTTIFSGGMIPFYMVLRSMGLTSSFWLYVIPSIYSFYNFVLLRTNFANIPYELRESAQLDGAKETTILMRIYIPLSKPILATLTLFYAVGRWNTYSDAMFYIKQNVSLRPLQLKLYYLIVAATESIQGSVNDVNMSTITDPEILKAACIVFATIPIICVYPFVQKYFVQGTMIGAVKG